LLRASLLHLINDLEAFDHATEHDVLAIEMWRGTEHETKLRSIGVGTRVRHLNQIASVMLEGQS